MKVNISGINNSISRLNSCAKKLREVKTSITSASSSLPVLDEDYNYFKGKMKTMLDKQYGVTTWVERLSSNLSSAKDSVVTSENKNKGINPGIMPNTSLHSVNINSNATKEDDLQKDVNINMKDSEIDADTPNDEEIDSKDDEINMSDKVPETQVVAVIEILYGKDAELTVEEKQRIVEAIGYINNTGLLDGLDEDICNMIRAQIVKDYIDGKLELEEIDREALESYINTQPAIKINLLLAESIKSLQSLIESGVITKKQVETIIKDNINIHNSDDEFMEAYLKAGGTETDISKVNYFYDKENKIIHMKNNVTSTEVTYAIVSEMDDMIIFDSKTGKPIYYKELEEINTDEINMKNNEVDSTIENVNIEDKNMNINMGNNEVDSTIENVNIKDKNIDKNLDGNNNKTVENNQVNIKE